MWLELWLQRHIFAECVQEGQLQYIAHHRPRAVVNENVPSLMFSNDGDSMLTAMIKRYEQIGYVAAGVLLAPTMVGIPQSRQRLYVLALDACQAWLEQTSGAGTCISA